MNVRLPIVIACLAGACLLQGRPQAQPAGPAALSDKEFWDLLVTLSEPDGFFEDENYVSNELGYQRTMARLQQSVRPGGVLLGVGPEQNFHYIAALEPALTFVIDIRRQNAIEHLMYKALFELASDRAEFVSLLFSRPRASPLPQSATVDALFEGIRSVLPDEAMFRRTLAATEQALVTRHGWPLGEADRAALAKVFTAFRDQGPELKYVFRGTTEVHPTYVQMMTARDESGRNWSYLESDAAFERVRLAQRRNLIVPVVGDFAGPKTLRAIGAYLHERGARVNMFYVSNVEPYLFTAGRSKAFYDNLLAVPFADDALFVRAFFGSTTRECATLRPTLRIPVVGSVRPVLDAHRSGTLSTQCALIGFSR